MRPTILSDMGPFAKCRRNMEMHKTCGLRKHTLFVTRTEKNPSRRNPSGEKSSCKAAQPLISKSATKCLQRIGLLGALDIKVLRRLVCLCADHCTCECCEHMLVNSDPHGLGVAEGLLCTLSLTRLRAGVGEQEGIEEVFIHFQALRLHLLSQALHFLPIPIMSKGPGEGGVGDNVRSDTLQAHLFEDKLGLFAIANFRASIQNTAENHNVNGNTVTLHLVQPVQCRINIACLCACVDDSTEGVSIRLHALEKHPSVPKLGAIWIPSFRASVNHRTVAHNIGLYAASNHLFHPLLSTS